MSANQPFANVWPQKLCSAKLSLLSVFFLLFLSIAIKDTSTQLRYPEISLIENTRRTVPFTLDTVRLGDRYLSFLMLMVDQCTVCFKVILFHFIMCRNLQIQFGQFILLVKSKSINIRVYSTINYMYTYLRLIFICLLLSAKFHRRA